MCVCVRVSVCGAGEWTCFNGRCLSSRLLLCDGVDDCSDRSDESYMHARCPGSYSLAPRSVIHNNELPAKWKFHIITRIHVLIKGK